MKEDLAAMINDTKKYNVGVISLGCDKNRVDTEKMLYRVKNFGHTIVNDIDKCDVVIINTCAFLQASREESIDTIIETASKDGSGKRKIIVTGCLPQKFIDEIYDSLTEANGFLGTADYHLINQAIETVMGGKRFNGVMSVSKSTAISNEKPNITTADKVYKKANTDIKDDSKYTDLNNTMYADESNAAYADKNYDSGRVLTTTPHYAYLMISDGCNNNCSYCLIPKIRGKYRSFKMENILREAKQLIEKGVKELILVAQDVTRYGIDLYSNYAIVSLLQNLSKLEGLNDSSIRLMYCYPERISDALIEEIAVNPKIIKYIDMPLQHVSDDILKGMKRQSTYDKICALIEKLRSRIPSIAIRSTFIVGFPGESDKDFEILCKFLSKYKLDNVGFFAFSKEKGTEAYNLNNQIHSLTKQKRLRIANELQQAIYREKNSQKLNQMLTVICDGYSNERSMYYGRTFDNAPLCDKLVYFIENSNDALCIGETYNVYIYDFDEYDLFGYIKI